MAVAIDLSKAFDSINHGLLLTKLQAYGFSHSAVKLMASYLVGRQQRVKVQGTFSTYRTITRGVPQGSILGPLLFNLFINDLNYSIPNLSLRIYVDDTTGYASNASPTVLEVAINDLKTLGSWFNANDLTVNNPKSQAISLGARAHNYHFEINDSNIELSDSLKILGVTLDRRLNFREHLRIQHKKIYSKTAALRRIRRFVPAETMVKLYKAYILPHFEYCSPLLITLAKTECKQMEDVNKYVLRTILEKSKSVPYEDLLMSAKTPSLLQRRTFQSLVLLYKCIFCNGPSYIKDLFEFRQSVYNLRGNG